MQIVKVNAEKNLAEILSSIGRNPSSWHGWYALRIDLQHEVEDVHPDESLIWIQSILESYLKAVDGRAYFCNGGQVHVICKNVAPELLLQAAEHIRDLAYAEDEVRTEFIVYDIKQDGHAYVSAFYDEHGDVFSFPLCNYSAVDHRPLLSLPDEDGHGGSIVQESKVLLVEDDPVTRWMVRNTLKSQCQFASAPSASQAFIKFQSFQPDVVFLDIDLPDQSGCNVLEWIMRNDPGACVVMFSSNHDLDMIAQTMDEGARGFISKPFLKDDLTRYIFAPKAD